jgi:hypothetical protein
MIPELTITQATAFLTVILTVLVCVLPRKYVLLPLVLTACFVPSNQYVYIFGLHFYVNRILIFAAIARIVLADEVQAIKWNRFDKLVLAWALVGSVIYILRRLDAQAVIYKSGVLVDVLGTYWIVRQTIRSWDDLRRAVAWFAVSTIVLTPFVALEWSTGVNPFLFLGARTTGFREGAFRCVASFRHPIVAGAFLACLVPLFIAQGLTARNRILYWCAVACGTFIVFASNSSTPIGGLGAVLFFCAMYRLRHYGRDMALMFFGTLVALHMVMKAPVWHLLARIQFVGGSTGYHRFLLIDRAIRHFSEWMFLGTDSTANWGYHLFDVTNQFILEGVRGGAITLILFSALLVVAVRTTGAYSVRATQRSEQWLSWAVCTSVLGHCIMFIGVGYFSQIEILLYLTFALVGFLYEQNTALVKMQKAQRIKVPRAHGSPAMLGRVEADSWTAPR